MVLIKKASTLAAATLVGTGLIVTGAAPASGDTPRCVSQAEFRRAADDMPKARVHRIFDTDGRRLFINNGNVTNEAREYRVCGHPPSTGSYVQVQYDNFTAGGGPLRLGRKQIHISD